MIQLTTRLKESHNTYFLIFFEISHPKSMLMQAMKAKITNLTPLSQGLNTFWGVCGRVGMGGYA